MDTVRCRLANVISNAKKLHIIIPNMSLIQFDSNMCFLNTLD